MKARFAGTVLLMIGSALVTFAWAAAGNDQNASDETVVINITGNGPNAKYLKEGDTEEKPVAVHVGQTVKWVNKGNLQHSATSFKNKGDKPIFDTDLIEPMQSKEITFDSDLFASAGGTTAGQIELTYFCTKHPTLMKNGKLTLSDARKK
jgi:plastocyanin